MYLYNGLIYLNIGRKLKLFIHYFLFADIASFSFLLFANSF